MGTPEVREKTWAKNVADHADVQITHGDETLQYKRISASDARAEALAAHEKRLTETIAFSDCLQILTCAQEVFAKYQTLVLVQRRHAFLTEVLASRRQRAELLLRRVPTIREYGILLHRDRTKEIIEDTDSHKVELQDAIKDTEEETTELSATLKRLEADYHKQFYDLALKVQGLPQIVDFSEPASIPLNARNFSDMPLEEEDDILPFLEKQHDRVAKRFKFDWPKTDHYESDKWRKMLRTRGILQAEIAAAKYSVRATPDEAKVQRLEHLVQQLSRNNDGDTFSEELDKVLQELGISPDDKQTNLGQAWLNDRKEFGDEDDYEEEQHLGQYFGPVEPVEDGSDEDQQVKNGGQDAPNPESTAHSSALSAAQEKSGAASNSKGSSKRKQLAGDDEDSPLKKKSKSGDRPQAEKADPGHKESSKSETSVVTEKPPKKTKGDPVVSQPVGRGGLRSGAKWTR